MVAIKIAIEYITEMVSTLNNDTPIVILSDSLSVLESLRVGKSTARLKLLIEVQTFLHDLNLINYFVWIPSNIGIAGNELEDTLADIANQKPYIELEVNLELQEAYSLVDKHILDLWQQKWNTCATGSFYRHLVPKVSNNIKYTNAARRKDMVITRLQLGKCKLNSYLYTINRHRDGLCSICNVPETI